MAVYGAPWSFKALHIAIPKDRPWTSCAMPAIGRGRRAPVPIGQTKRKAGHEDRLLKVGSFRSTYTR